MKPLRILIVCPRHLVDIGGGIESYLRELVPLLKASGHEVTVLSAGPRDESSTSAQFGEIVTIRHPAFEYLVKGCGPRGMRMLFHLMEIFSTRMARRIVEIIQNRPCDIILSHGFYGLGRGLPQRLRKLGIGWVHFVHAYDLVCKRQTAIKKNGTPCTLPCADCRAICRFNNGKNTFCETPVVFNSEYMSRFCHAGGIRPRRQHIVPPVLINAPHEVASSYQITDMAKLVYVGRVTFEKGISILCDVVAQHSSKFALDVLGRGGALLDTLRQRYGHSIRFHGQLDPDQVTRILRDAHALVVPSLWNEPFGRVVYEGLLSGVPVIASRAGGIPEMITHGVDGFLFECERGNEARSIETALLSALPLLPKLRQGALQRRSQLARTDLLQELLRIIVENAGQRAR